MAAHPCPVCGHPVEPECSKVLPFCSPRCRQIDLARWLDERYGLPYESRDEQPDKPPDSGDVGQESGG